MGKIILTGDRPTGKLHLGHYIGSLQRRVTSERWRLRQNVRFHGRCSGFD